MYMYCKYVHVDFKYNLNILFTFLLKCFVTNLSHCTCLILCVMLIIFFLNCIYLFFTKSEWLIFSSWTQGSYLNHSFSWVTLLSQLLNHFAGTANMTLSSNLHDYNLWLKCDHEKIQKRWLLLFFCELSDTARNETVTVYESDRVNLSLI